MFTTNLMERRERTIALKISCQQEWSSMADAGAGKFCAHCAKTVVDFTQSTDKEILETISNATGKLCGRLSNHQLNRPLVPAGQPATYPNLYRLLAGLFVIGMVDNTVASTVQHKPGLMAANNNQVQFEQRLELEERATQTSDTLNNTIQGTIIDEPSREPLLAVWIGIKDTKLSTTTDSTGRFSLDVPDNLTTPIVTIVVKYMGYMTAEISYNRLDLPVTHRFIPIFPDQVSMGEVIVVDKKESGKLRKQRHR